MNLWVKKIKILLSIYSFCFEVKFQRTVSAQASMFVLPCGGSSTCAIMSVSAVMRVEQSRNSGTYTLDLLTRTRYPYRLNATIQPTITFYPNSEHSNSVSELLFESETTDQCTFDSVYDLTDGSGTKIHHFLFFVVIVCDVCFSVRYTL